MTATAAPAVEQNDVHIPLAKQYPALLIVDHAQGRCNTRLAA
ncbi:hypothetical protein ACIBGM_04325 [Kribbella sp. NPDC050470]